MLVHPGCHLGDSWYLVDDDDVVHCYYLVCSDRVERHTSGWDIAHATSPDLTTWELHGIVLEPGAPDAWDGGGLATGSVIKFRDNYVMAFTARWNETGVTTGLATSNDLYVWRRDANRPATQPSAPYVTDRPWRDRPPTHWRDPFLMVDGDDLVQLIAASRPDRPDDASGTVAVVRSSDLSTWRIESPLEVDAVTRELECPQLRDIAGASFLIFSAFPELFSAETRDDTTARLEMGTYAMVAPSRWGPYRFVQRYPIVPSNGGRTIYAGQVLHHHGTAYLMGTVWCEDQPDYLTNPTPLRRHGDLLIAD
jgi:beta-fructofuranosidase